MTIQEATDVILDFVDDKNEIFEIEEGPYGDGSFEIHSKWLAENKDHAEKIVIALHTIINSL